MHRHLHVQLVRAAARPGPQRPAKVIQLEARRAAKRKHLERLPPRPAA
jgi:hypothetical protein